MHSILLLAGVIRCFIVCGISKLDEMIKFKSFVLYTCWISSLKAMTFEVGRMKH